jgi:hypothetical protein
MQSVNNVVRRREGVNVVCLIIHLRTKEIVEIAEYTRARNRGAPIEKQGGMLLGLTWFGNINSQGSPGF